MVGQRDMFLEIWDERKHTCSVCYTPLGNEPNAWFFAHVLSKGAYPAFKLRKKKQSVLKMPGYPIFPLVFIILSLTILVLAYLERPVESSIALLIILVGIPVYYLLK